MSRNAKLLGSLCAVLIVGLLVGLTASGRIPLFGRTTSGQVSSGAPAVQGYPPPTPRKPTATTGPDSQGYLPIPSGITATITTLGGSAYASLLEPLQKELDDGDSTAIAARVSPDDPLHLFGLSELDSEGGEAIDGATAAGLLESFFSQGSKPLVQGYLASPGDSGLTTLHVLSYPWSGDVPFPTPQEGWGPPPPASIPGGAALWTFTGGEITPWALEDWVYGVYESLVGRFVEPRQVYWVIRP